MKNQKILYFQYLLLFFFSIFFFRGRLGSDDLEVFNLVIAYKEMGLSLSDFSNFIKDNFEDKKLNLEYFANTNSLPDFKTLHVRFIWLLQSYFIISLVEIFQLSKDNFMFLSQYLCGLIISIYTCLSFLLLTKFFQKSLDLHLSVLLSLLIFFGTGLISFFTGSYIESLIVLLIISRQLIKNKYFIFLIDYLTLLIKPYYFLILIAFSYFNLSKKNFVIKSVYPVILFLSIVITRQNLFDVSYDQYTSDYSNFYLNIYFSLNNFFDLLFSFGYGIFFTSIIPVLLIICGYKKNQTIFKILAVILLMLFFSLFEGNHGQVPGGRYFLPVIFIFIDEFVKGFSIIFTRYKTIFYTLILLLILNLPTLEYRNFSLPQYHKNSALTGISPKILTTKTGHEYPVRKLYFNHIIFANKVLISKINKIEFLNFGKYNLQNQSIYPMTGIARVIYILESDNKIYKDQIPKFLNKIITLLKFVYFTTIISFLSYLIFIIVSTKKKI